MLHRQEAQNKDLLDALAALSGLQKIKEQGSRLCTDQRNGGKMQVQRREGNTQERTRDDGK